MRSHFNKQLSPWFQDYVTCSCCLLTMRLAVMIRLPRLTPAYHIMRRSRPELRRPGTTDVLRRASPRYEHSQCIPNEIAAAAAAAAATAAAAAAAAADAAAADTAAAAAAAAAASPPPGRGASLRLLDLAGEVLLLSFYVFVCFPVVLLIVFLFMCFIICV